VGVEGLPQLPLCSRQQLQLRSAVRAPCPCRRRSVIPARLEKDRKNNIPVRIDVVVVVKVALAEKSLRQVGLADRAIVLGNQTVVHGDGDG